MPRASASPVSLSPAPTMSKPSAIEALPMRASVTATTSGKLPPARLNSVPLAVAISSGFFANSLSSVP